MLIVGGSIAGLSTAIGLGRLGIRCDVIDLHESPDGAAINIQPGACHAFKQLGVLEQLKAVSSVNENVFYVVYSPDGEPAYTFELPAAPEWEPIRIGIDRRILVRVLAAAACDHGASVRTGLTVGSLRQDGDGVDVTLTDGSSGRYDLVVGADGGSSQIRRTLWGIEPRLTGMGAIRWMPPAPSGTPPFGSFANNRLLLWYPLPGDECELVYIGLQLIPEKMRYADDELPPILSAAFEELLAEGGGSPRLAWIAELNARLKSRPEGLMYHHYRVCLVPDPWYRGRVLVVGDAAHTAPPHIGAMGSLAVEDAVVLAECVEEQPAVEHALVRFMERRFPRAKLIVENSAQLDTWYQEAPAAGDELGHRRWMEQRESLRRESLVELAKPF